MTSTSECQSDVSDEPREMLAAKNIVKRFQSANVLDGVSLTVKKGETVCIIGPSGSGKTTFLRCLNHLVKPDAGIVVLDRTLIGYRQHRNHLVELSERDIARQRRDIGMVFQQFNLFGHMSVMDNVIDAPVRVLKRNREEMLDEASKLLADVGLAERAKAVPSQLSGGQQQRVAIARALAMRPKVMLFDEPTSALDPELVGGVLNVIKAVTASGMTSVIVTHEIGFARSAADRIVFMDNGQVVEEGDARQLLESPRHNRTKEFLRAVL